MTRHDDIVYQEAADLWRALHGEPLPEGLDGRAMLDLILGGLPETRYERLATSHLRPSNIAFPQRG